MKNKDKKLLRTKLLTSIKKVIKDNNANLSKRVEKDLKKSVRQIVKKTDKEKTGVSTNKMRKPILKSNANKVDGVVIDRPRKQPSS
jgi:hypothetical protein